MAKIGYARVSTHGQHEDSQIAELETYGCDKIFTDKGVSGKLASRPEFDKALAYLRPGDQFVITRLSRAMRSIHHLLDVVNGTSANNYEDGLKARGIGLVVIKQGIDTTTPQGRLIFHILAAIDEFQRELIVEGTNEGLAAAKAKGRVGGRPPKMTGQQVDAARGMLAETIEQDGQRIRKYTQAEVAAILGVSRETLRLRLDPDKQDAANSRRRDSRRGAAATS